MNSWLEEDSDWMDETMKSLFSQPWECKQFWYKGIYYNTKTGEPSWEAIRAVGEEWLSIIEKGEL